MLRKTILALAAFAALACGAHAQFLGYVSPQTVNQQVFTNTSCASGLLVSSPLQNVGQSVHIVQSTLSFTNGDVQPVVEILGSADGVNYKIISDYGMGGTSSILVGYGVFAYIQVAITGGTTGCLATLSYQGTSVSPQNNVGQSDVTAYQKYIFSGVSVGSNQNSAQNILPPYGSSGGVLVINGGGFPSGSTISVTANSANNATQTTIATFSIENTNAPQTFVVPSVPTAQVNVYYVSGGASANTFNATYIFLKPGANDMPLCEKSYVINTASAGPTQIVAAVAGAQVRVCSISVGSGTAEGIDFQQGVGSNCGTGNSQLTGVYHLAANAPTTQSFPGGGLVALPGNAMCIHLSGANQTDGQITFSDY